MRSGVSVLRFRYMLLVVLVLVGCTATLAQDNPAVPVPADDAGAVMPDPVLELWRGMFEAGMIDDAQYQHVLQHGRLPGGSTVQNSPVDPARQSVWQGLAARKLITPEELAQMLFKGTIPNLTEAETKAFEELAPVYEPDRSKRLTYDIRRKHQRVELIRLQKRLSREWTERHEKAVERAGKDGFPPIIERRDGERLFLDGYEHGVPAYLEPLNANAAATISTDHIYAGSTNDFSLSGTDVIIGLWDSGLVRTSHQEFATNRISLEEGGMYPSDHATGVAGTLAATGVNPAAKGMAPAATVHVRSSSGSLGELAAALTTTDMRVSNHSYANQFVGWGGVFSLMWYGDITLSTWEDPKHGRYNENAQALDEVVYTAAYHIPVWAGGNERNDTPASQPVEHGVMSNGVWDYHSYMIHGPEGGADGNHDTLLDYPTAKNPLVVGSVLDLPNGYTGTQSVEASAFSSFGPTDDGRIKPDIVANGQGVYTTDDDSDSDYKSHDGTSFSAPSACGSLAALVEFHQTLYGTNSPMLASTLKAIAIHTADEAGAAPGPDYGFGWGLMNSLRAAWTITNNAAWNSMPHIKEVSLADGDYIEFDALASSNEALRVTICWTDPPGPVQPYAVDPTNRVLVNDLDLRVISSDGNTTNYPWVLDPVAYSNAATTGDNFRDNVEQVLIEEPTNGWYTVRVTHKGSLSNGVQDVSIIVTGNTPTNAPDFRITDIGVVGTNGFTQLEWPGVVGAVYEVETSTNLLVSNAWTNANLTLSANRELLEWTDADSESYDIRFYRLKRLK